MFRFVTHISPVAAVPYWFTKYGSMYNEPDHVIVDPAGNTYSIATTTDYTAGGIDLIVFKTNSDGEGVWAKSMGNVLSEDSGGTMCFDQQGNICLAASVQHKQVPHLFVCKITPSGSVVWSKVIKDAIEWYACGGYGVICDNNNDLLVTGNATTTADENNGDAFLLKLDSSGNIVWQTSITVQDWNYGSSIAVDQTNNVYLISRESDDTIPSLPDGYIMLTKFSAAGTALWSRAIGFAQQGYTDFNYPAGIVVNNGYVYMTGEITNSADVNGDPSRGLVMKLDANTGDMVWSRVFFVQTVYNGISYDGDNVHVAWNTSPTTPQYTVMTLSGAGDTTQTKAISFTNQSGMYITSATKMGNHVYISGSGHVDLNSDFTNGIVSKIPIDGVANGTYGVYTIQDAIVAEDPLTIINVITTPSYTATNLIETGVYVNVYDVNVVGLVTVGDLVSVKYVQNNSIYFPAAASGADGAGHRYITGQLYDPVTYGSVLAVIKVDGNANTQLWTNLLTSVLPYGGWEPAGHFVHIVDSGSSILFGVTGKEENSTSDRDWFVCKHDTSGASIWQKRIGTPDFDITMQLLSNTVDAFIVSDVFDSTAGSYGVEIMRLDSTGNVTWHSRLIDTDSMFMNGVCSTNTGSHTVMGLQCNATNTSAVALIDNTGQLLWCRDIVNSLAVVQSAVAVRDVCLDDSNNVYACLYYQDLTSALIKIDVNGDLIWHVDIGANEYWITHAATWDNGYVYVAGEYAIVKLAASDGAVVWKKAIYEQTAVNIQVEQGIVYMNSNTRYFNDCAGLQAANISDSVGTSISLVPHSLTPTTGVLSVNATSLPFVADTNGDVVLTHMNIQNGVTFTTTPIVV